MKLVVAPLDAPVTWDGSAAAGATRPPRSALPRADTNRGFRVGRSIFDATRHAGGLRRPRRTRERHGFSLGLQGRLARSTAVSFFAVLIAPRERPWFSFGGLQGRSVGSTAVRFFDANGSGRLIPSASAARHHSICPGPTSEGSVPDLARRWKTPATTMPSPVHVSSSSSALASFRSAVSNPSVNQPSTGARRSRASARRPRSPHNRARLAAARSS